MKITKKISYSFSITLLILLAIMGTVTCFITFTNMLELNKKLIAATSKTQTQLIKTYLTKEETLIKTLQANSILKDFLAKPSTTLKNKVAEVISPIIIGDPTITEISVADVTGKIVASSIPSQIGKASSEVQNDVYFSKENQLFEWGVSAPVQSTIDGAVIGSIFVQLKVAPLFELLKPQSILGDTGEVIILNKDRKFITPSRFLGEAVILNMQINTQNSKECFEKKDLSAVKNYLDYRNVPIFGNHSYIEETGWCLITKMDQREVYIPILHIILIYLGIMLLSALIFFGISTVIAKRITKPIEELERGSLIIQKGNLDYKIGLNSNDELGNLARQFDRMTSSIRNNQKEVKQKVEEQTKEIGQKNIDLQDQQNAILNVLNDVEREKEKSELLATDLQKFKYAVDNTEEHIVITDPNGIIIYANRAVTEITGFDIKDILGKKVGTKELWGGQMAKEVYNNFWETIKNKKQPFTGIFNNIKKNGSHYLAEATVAPVLDVHKNIMFFVGIERDVTKAKEVDRMKTEFISLASHQLRTPLSAMKWLSEMLLNGDAGKVTGTQKEYITNISLANERMIALVNSLLNISRIESGRIIIQPEPTNLGALIKEVTAELQNKITEKKHTLTISISPDIGKINIDPKLIREVYKNLISNAIKYTPEKGKISIVVTKEAPNVISKVSDTGYGIPDSDKSKLFQKFFRATNVAKVETDGTGLGLYLAKTIVESSNGTLSFESKENNGTTFTFTLPLAGVAPKEGNVSLS